MDGVGTGVSRVLVVDDHPLVRAGFRALIDAEADMEVCGEAGGGDEALRLVEALQPDLAIVDLSLSQGSGLDVIKRLHLRHPGLRVLVCSMHDDALFAARAVHAGARGYVNKQEATDHVVEALRRVMAGELYLSKAVMRRMGGHAPASGGDGVEHLTDRELEVFGFIGQGLGTSAIAERMHLSVKTIETHREKIKRKLNLESGGALVRYAMQWTMDQH